MEKGLTKFQLAAIGAVALAYNELEVAVDLLRSTVIALPHEAGNSVTREAKIGSIAKGLANVELETEDQKQIKHALDVFQEFTIYQDAINHVRLMNLMSVGNSDLNLRKGKSVDAFSDKALNIFYDHLIALEKELSSAAMLVQSLSVLKSRALVDLTRSSYTKGKRACTSQFRGYGTRRQALPPMPWLPSESDLREVKTKWQQAQVAELMTWLTAWPDAGSTIESSAHG